MNYLLVVINNFDLFRTGSGPAEANPELPVDSNAVLTLPVTMQRLQHIAGRYFKIIQLACSLKLPNFPQGNALEIYKKARRSSSDSKIISRRFPRDVTWYNAPANSSRSGLANLWLLP